MEPNLWDINVGASIPFFFWKKERKGVEEAAAELRGSANYYEATAQESYRQVKDAYLSVTAADRLIRLYKEALIPQASTALESSLAAYRVGRVDFLSILNNWTVIVNFQLEYYNQVSMREAAIADLERLTGIRLLKTGGVK
jgi:outer membrane protein TolC